VIADGMRALVTYHTHPVVTTQGEQACVEGMKLLFYYQNRTHHIPAEVAA
jgi:hypothetical protein